MPNRQKKRPNTHHDAVIVPHSRPHFSQHILAVFAQQLLLNRSVSVVNPSGARGVLCFNKMMIAYILFLNDHERVWYDLGPILAIYIASVFV